MRIRIGIIGSAVFVSAAAALFSQDLAEAAKKEKARRAAFKDKAVVVLTSDAMAGLKKKPAVSVTSEALPPSESQDKPLPAAGGPVDTEASPDRTVPFVTVVQPTEQAGTGGEGAAAGTAADAETRWKKAKEYADLLELKLNALWLQFYSLDDGMPRELLQQEIADVFEKYTRAREEETRLGEGIAPKKDEDG
ncbi:MAG: hypothetical protein JW747_01840 [Candidatus Aminicenantes bacterium]|nr:hypothetical protein [Candidatus Aminicenantes bacterium]